MAVLYNLHMSENNTKKETTMDDLAGMVQNGFLGMDKRMDKLESDMESLKSDVSSLKSDMAVVKDTMGNIEAELNKKVDKFEHNDLKYRVEKLEKKFA